MLSALLYLCTVVSKTLLLAQPADVLAGDAELQTGRDQENLSGDVQHCPTGLSGSRATTSESSKATHLIFNVLP